MISARTCMMEPVMIDKSVLSVTTCDLVWSVNVDVWRLVKEAVSLRK